MRRITLIIAGVALSGAALAAPFSGVRGSAPASAPRGRAVASPRVGSSGPGAPVRSASPRIRGGSGTLGGYMRRSPSQRGSRSGNGFYSGPYYDGYYSPYYLSPYFYDPFYSGSWGSVSSSPYRDQDNGSKSGNIQLQVEPKDVEVIVDGIPTAHGGRATLALPSGMHHIEVIRSGYRPWSLDLDVQQGVRYRLEQRLERLPKEERESGADRPGTRQAGELRLDVRPNDAIVDLDGRTMGMVDLLRGSEALRRIPAGHHTLRFTRPGYKTVERRIDVTPGRPARMNLELERE